jgi:hypothetical protein
MHNLWQKLKVRWAIESNWQVLLILIAFSLAGPSTLYFHRKIDLLLGITDDSSFWLKLLVFMIVVLPLYNFFLFIYGLLLGQYHFMMRFILKKINLLQRIQAIFKKSN